MHSNKGFISDLNFANEPDGCTAEKLASAIVDELMQRNILSIRRVNVSYTSGVIWEIADPDVSALKNKISDLVCENERLSRRLKQMSYNVKELDY